MLQISKRKNIENPKVIKLAESGLCSGCGVCSGVCPKGCLKMKENEFGEYCPSIQLSQCISCGTCDQVCPFLEDIPDLDKDLFSEINNISHNPKVGYYLKSYCGGISDELKRKSRTSGGLLSWVLQKLLKDGVVDRIISVRNGDSSYKLFEFEEFVKAEDIWNAARSSYYPVEISGLLRKILISNFNYAIVGLPCLIKGIRKAQDTNPILKKRILITLGLVCSHQKSKWFAEYLIRKSDFDFNSVTKFSFRVKRENEPARNSTAIEIETIDGKKIIENHKEYDQMWSGGYFKLNACNYCDDLFSNYADAAFMDAWLPQYWDDPIGTSIVITRNEKIHDILLAGLISGELSINELDILQTIFSQSKGRGKSIEKNCQLILSAIKLPFDWRRKIQWCSFLRVETLFRKYMENKRTIFSREAFIVQRSNGSGVEIFWEQFNKLYQRFMIIERLVLKIFYLKRVASNYLRGKHYKH